MAIVSSRKPVWITLGAALVFHALLISVQTNHRFDTGLIRSWLLDIQAPFEQLAERGVGATGGVWNGYFALVGLHTENQKLHSEIDRLKMELAKRQEESEEVKRLRGLAGLQDPGIGKTIVARVIGRDPAQQHLTLTIDKGRSQGVKPDSAVMTPDGIVGRVIYVSNFYAVVQLILDTQSSVGAIVQSTRRQAILNGNGGRELDLDFIDDDNDIKEGDKFVTSGQDRIYPKGLPVGTIISIGPRRGMFKTVRIRPQADFERIEEVICVIDRPQSPDVPETFGPPWQP